VSDGEPSQAIDLPQNHRGKKKERRKQQEEETSASNKQTPKFRQVLTVARSFRVGLQANPVIRVLFVNLQRGEEGACDFLDGEKAEKAESGRSPVNKCSRGKLPNKDSSSKVSSRQVQTIGRESNHGDWLQESEMRVREK